MPKVIRPKVQHLALLALLAMAFLVSACGAASGIQVRIMNAIASSIPANTWDELLRNFTNASICAAPGAGLLVDSPGGRFLQATGVSSLEDNTPTKVTDAFEIGSNTKSFTVVLALQLQEQGVWSLDDPLRKWLPDVAAQIPNGDQVTLRQLAGNTSGIWDYANPLLGSSVESPSLRQQAYTPQELIDYTVSSGTPDFRPGEGWAYSSTNFVILGMAVEAASGQSLAELYQERIFTPLGMHNTFLLDGVPRPGQIVQGYYFPEDRQDEKVQPINATDWNGSQAWAAGAIVSTAEDVASYVEAFASGALFTSPDSLAQMTAFQDVDPTKAGLMTGYGLGVGVLPSPVALGWGHHGQTLGHTSMFMTIPEKETNVVYLTNGANCSVALLAAAIKEPLLSEAE